ncbi:MAG: YbhB/YbcL family Raf kinase inhibitor-like protein [Euryarchaeota archaeon]|nr:YbhB/YbcL family Raf kinase inhibitor-like protein [Euryarchaeota archaeon]
MHRIQEQVEHMPREKSLDVTVESGEFDIDETCEGLEYSPRIDIENLHAPFLAVLMEDADHPTGNFPHWLLWNVEQAEMIPRNLPKQEVFEQPVRGVQGRNGFGRIGYDAPCPPQGAKRRYRFRVFGLVDKLDLRAGAAGREMEKALEGQILQYGEAIVTYERPDRKNIP